VLHYTLCYCTAVYSMVCYCRTDISDPRVERHLYVVTNIRADASGSDALANAIMGRKGMAILGIVRVYSVYTKGDICCTEFGGSVVKGVSGMLSLSLTAFPHWLMFTPPPHPQGQTCSMKRKKPRFTPAPVSSSGQSYSVLLQCGTSLVHVRPCCSLLL
jgi:hypothetical protein